MDQTLRVRWLGRVSYSDAWALQKGLYEFGTFNHPRPRCVQSFMFKHVRAGHACTDTETTIFFGDFTKPIKVFQIHN